MPESGGTNSLRQVAAIANRPGDRGRLFARCILSAALLVSQGALAQEQRVYRIGAFSPESAEAEALAAFFDGELNRLGYFEGRNVRTHRASAGKNRERLAQAAEELVAAKPDVLVAWESDATALRAKTTSIPIVLTGGFDPVGAGLVKSLGRPGTNVTGVTQLNAELPGKHVELLNELLPRFSRVGLLVDKSSSGCLLVEKALRGAAARLGKSAMTFHVKNRSEIERAFASMEKARPDALVPCPSTVSYIYRDLLFSEGQRLRIPWSSFIVDNVPAGVLFAYSSSRPEEVRKAAQYVVRILKGEQPANMPIEQPSRFELVINQRTARALGVTIPSTVLLRADRVIE